MKRLISGVCGLVAWVGCVSGGMAQGTPAAPKGDELLDKVAMLELPLVEKTLARKIDDPLFAEMATPKKREKIYASLAKQVAEIVGDNDRERFSNVTHATRLEGFPAVLHTEAGRIRAVSLAFKAGSQSAKKHLTKLREQIERDKLPIKLLYTSQSEWAYSGKPTVVTVTIPDGYWYVAMHPELPAAVKEKLSKEEICMGAPKEIMLQLLGKPSETSESNGSTYLRWEMKDWSVSLGGIGGSYSGATERTVRVVRATFRDGIVTQLDDRKYE